MTADDPEPFLGGGAWAAYTGIGRGIEAPEPGEDTEPLGLLAFWSIFCFPLVKVTVYTYPNSIGRLF